MMAKGAPRILTFCGEGGNESDGWPRRKKMVTDFVGNPCLKDKLSILDVTVRIGRLSYKTVNVAGVGAC